ncbi:MAG: ASCH domain-containing protein [Oscillospiraceae bacterium]|jgi:uncharacterized protein YhfF|nr:ASCH domain-containing protein [Oscillospiraceae bacterium]
MTVDEFWGEFLASAGIDGSTKYIDAFHFAVGEEWANKLLDLALSGKKKATTSAAAAFERSGIPLPKPGDYSVVTDWAGNPRCVIQTTAVAVMPFNEMTFALCGREGEDDTLGSWQDGHRRFFAEEGRALGYGFSETMPVVFEDFKVVFIK